MCPDWNQFRTRHEVEPALGALRRLVLPKTRKPLRGAAGLPSPAGHARIRPYQGGPAELALDETLQNYHPGLPLSRQDLWVRQKEEPSLNLLVLLDTSLSLSGPARLPAAVAGAVLAREAAIKRLSLVAFHAESEVVIRFGEPIRPLEAALKVLRLKWGGITDLNQALEIGLTLLQRRPPGRTHTVLITDAERTHGGDPEKTAIRYKDLHVVLLGRRNLKLANRLTNLGRGLLQPVEGLNQLPQALMDLLSGLARR